MVNRGKVFPIWRRKMGWTLHALIPLALAGCTSAPAHERAALPRIASLNPCTDAILAEVADPAQIAGLSAYSSDPASSSMDVATARRFPALAGTVEEVAAVRPDLVLAAPFISPASAGALQRLGFKIERIGIAPTVEDSKAQIRQIAALAGHPERGAALIGRIDRALAQAAPPPGPPVPALVWQGGGMVPGQGTLIADLLRRTGFADAAAARGLRQADILPLEQVLAQPPRLILTAGNMHGNEDRLLRHPALAALHHTARARLDPNLLWCGGPTIIRAAARLGEVRRGLALGPSTGSGRTDLGVSSTIPTSVRPEPVEGRKPNTGPTT